MASSHDVIQSNKAKLAHSQQDCLTDILWLKETFISISFPKRTYPEQKHFDDLFAYGSWLRHVSEYFRNTPQSDFCPVSGLEDSKFKGGLTREQFQFFVYLNQNRQSNNQRNSELNEIIQISQCISLVETFITDCISLLATTFSENIIYSLDTKTLPIDLLFEHSTTESIINRLAQDEVIKISYKSIPEQLKLISKKFSIKYDISPYAIESYVEYKETRNIHIHNRGIVNKSYINKTQNPFNLIEGHYRSLKSHSLNGNEYISNMYDICQEFINFFAGGVYEKFKNSAGPDTSVQ